MVKRIRVIVICIGILLLTYFTVIMWFVWGNIRSQEFIEKEGVFYRVAGDDSYKTLDAIDDGFEEVTGLLELIKQDDPYVFTQITLQSSSAPNVSEYVALRKCILSGECDFKDNRIDVSNERAHAGDNSLRFYAVPPPDGIVSKSCIDTMLLHFAEGDDLWFSAWYYLEKGRPTTLADFETSAMKWGPGPRLLLFDDHTQLGVELKHGSKPTYRQDRETAINFPIGRWLRVALHLKLSASDEGLVEVWQDCKLLVRESGKTLPKKSAILDRMQLGITATNVETVLYVDDVTLSRQGSAEVMESKCSALP